MCLAQGHNAVPQVSLELVLDDYVSRFVYLTRLYIFNRRCAVLIYVPLELNCGLLIEQ